MACWIRRAVAFAMGVALIKAGWPIAGVLVGSASINAWLMDRLANRVKRGEEPAVTEAGKALHAGAFVVDLHADVCLWERDWMKRNARGHVDLPRLRDGNVALQFVTIPTMLTLTKRAPRLFFADLFFWGFFASFQHPSLWFSTAARARYQLANAKRWIDRAGGELVLVSDKAGLAELRRRRESGDQVIGIMLGLEGAHAMRGGIDVPWLAENGFRVLGPNHFNDTRFGDSAHGWRKRGLSDAGRTLVRDLDGHGITIDLAHASAAVIDDCLEMLAAGELTRPFLVTHTGVKGVHNHRRNLSNEQAIAIARSGGLLGVTFFVPALARLEIAAVTEAVAYLIKLFDQEGIDGSRHVALGSDFDGAVTTMVDAADWGLLTEALLAEGLSDRDVHRVLGENAAQFFADWLPE